MLLKTEILSDIIQRINKLEQRYEELSQGGDVKYLNGMERCIELLMKVYGVDGKNSYDIIENSQDKVKVDMSRLSSSTLSELISVLENK